MRRALVLANVNPVAGREGPTREVTKTAIVNKFYNSGKNVKILKKL